MFGAFLYLALDRRSRLGIDERHLLDLVSVHRYIVLLGIAAWILVLLWLGSA